MSATSTRRWRSIAMRWVFHADEWRMTNDPNTGWMAFGTGDGSVEGPVTGKYLRLSWLSPNRIDGAWDPKNSETSNLKGFELFVTAVPEPTSMTILGGVAWLIRRRRGREG